MSWKSICNIKVYISIFSLLCSPLSFSASKKKFIKNESRAIKEYLKIHKKFSKQVCRPGVEEKFNKLTSNFMGSGYFIPTLSKSKIDIETINKFIPELHNKIKWLKEEINKVKRKRNFKSEIRLIKRVEDQLSLLVKYKQNFYEANSIKSKNQAKNKSKYSLINFKKTYSSLLQKIPFLLSYRFPVDHMELRLNYDKYKSSKKSNMKRKANEVYFYRKIVEEGAIDLNNSRSDRFIRAYINTITIQLEKNKNFIDERLRYDLEDALSSMEYQLKRGKKKILERLNYWVRRVQNSITFYESIKKNKIFEKNKYYTGKDILANKAQSRYILRNYALKKMAESYKFWSKQSEVNRALFSLETILFNEVGRVDGPGFLERKDVSQVVINRSKLQSYQSINKRDSIYRHLKAKKIKRIGKYKWLNVLFDEGEFSFTYYFIRGNAKIYCPDMSRIGKNLRLENLKISASMLNNPNYEFKAVRYFSRASMLGRIDMAKLWKSFTPIKESPGILVKRFKNIKRSYQNGKYKYLYQFVGSDDVTYKVVEISKEKYVMPVGKNIFYHYRNPNYFTFFEKTPHF